MAQIKNKYIMGSDTSKHAVLLGNGCSASVIGVRCCSGRKMISRSAAVIANQCNEVRSKMPTSFQHRHTHAAINVPSSHTTMLTRTPLCFPEQHGHSEKANNFRVGLKSKCNIMVMIRCHGSDGERCQMERWRSRSHSVHSTEKDGANSRSVNDSESHRAMTPRNENKTGQRAPRKA